MATSTIQKIQTLLGTNPDGIWGPKSQTALNNEIAATGGEGNPTLKKIQKMLGVTPDGFWGPISQGALNAAQGGGASGGGTGNSGSSGAWFSMTASSFADPADVVAFKKCKATGKTDKQCFAVGDNGIGQFGKVTAQTTTPMVAVHRDAMVARWGSVNAAAHRAVEVEANGKTVVATVEDRISAPGRIDLNPAAAKALGLNPPFLKPCRWRWL